MKSTSINPAMAVTIATALPTEANGKAINRGSKQGTHADTSKWRT